ncbi:unnamed protein product (macronuclear) [Paramecium tetraurelia]|uniref:Transmembrane protein n=1 Tax=Paramecium tetraurelia TaxID=5888 RepID=A0BLQ0_PARTE|nr:uncharacterized protein GSPATT00030100001 [Paramecium tetraurelia]CAK59467.1 unnamed protein product [Paramecium tetraurelia]|eukprot:XP_001426865.1 hypothetical protein (macronuclear) [Paramecium tetraurelia strain d4-2]
MEQFMYQYFVMSNIVKIDRTMRPKMTKNLYAQTQTLQMEVEEIQHFQNTTPSLKHIQFLLLIQYSFDKEISQSLQYLQREYFHKIIRQFNMAYFGIGTVSLARVASFTITSPQISRQSQFIQRCFSIKNQSPTTNSLPSINLLSINQTCYLIFANFSSYILDFLRLK